MSAESMSNILTILPATPGKLDDRKVRALSVRPIPPNERFAKATIAKLFTSSTFVASTTITVEDAQGNRSWARFAPETKHPEDNVRGRVAFAIEVFNELKDLGLTPRQIVSHRPAVTRPVLQVAEA